MSTLEELLDPDVYRTVSAEEYEMMADRVLKDQGRYLTKGQIDKILRIRKNIKNKENAKRRRVELKQQDENNKLILQALADENIRLALEVKRLREMLDLYRLPSINSLEQYLHHN